MVDEFLNSLAETNRSHLFYVDWGKAQRNQELYKDELALLQVMSREGIEPRQELARLIGQYPRINALVPLLAACRIKAKNKKDVAKLLVIDEHKAETVTYTFGVTDLTLEDIKRTVNFAHRVGLLQELVHIKNPADYYFGIEVGMDTNARKNRSGTAMEALVEGYIRQLAHRHGGEYYTQMKFSVAAKKFGVAVPPDQSNKKGDFMMQVAGKPYNIEANYFDDSGSKQEIMNSYISRAHDLQQAGWGFALVTDGQGWLSGRNQLLQGYERIKHIYNIRMCVDGKLENILTQLR